MVICLSIVGCARARTWKLIVAELWVFTFACCEDPLSMLLHYLPLKHNFIFPAHGKGMFYSTRNIAFINRINQRVSVLTS
jgi:hypothetical protein